MELLNSLENSCMYLHNCCKTMTHPSSFETLFSAGFSGNSLSNLVEFIDFACNCIAEFSIQIGSLEISSFDETQMASFSKLSKCIVS